MLAELSLYLQPEKGQLHYEVSSCLQGVLMERIDTEYASVLHQTGFNPYSISLTGIGKPVWHIRTTNREAYEKIILPMMAPDFDSFTIKDDQKITVTDRKLCTEPRRKLMEEFTDVPCGRNFDLVFETPTSFKTNGRYWILPDNRLILQSLMNKYNASAGSDARDPETLEQIVLACEPARFDVRSATFPLDGAWVPAFSGKYGIRVFGSETLARYVRLLLHFGRYSGVGIKTGVGMGAMNYTEVMKRA